ncbi:S26 family signal peptidase [Candidatus Karelsulcia muelleri]|uniref:S26 family signal peptidase n=1 Tax=Candidatus Karelsulcia muelleri TaxID=336810 RepID=UPI0007F98F9D|nr:S26 family signal peptidase [Candidatus Karelsulcia muelleri]ANO35764.1 hypothetical protein BA057_00710 [Candidatus Karelsulcia muelleri]WKD87284.1 S26 family signal peptidase [Candidatus Karelsulcia muelleri]
MKRLNRLIRFFYLCLDIIKKMLRLITLGGLKMLKMLKIIKNKKRSSSIFFSIIFTSIINIYIIQPFVIPTPSMKDSLLVGDFLFVSKLHIRIPKITLF